MKTIIIYSSKHGFTARIAEKIYNEISGEKRLIKFGSDIMPDIENFDNILLAGSIRIGTLNKKFKKFIDTNTALFAKKRLFLLYAAGNKEQENIEMMFNETLFKTAKGIYWLGSEMIIKKLDFIERLLLSMMKKMKNYTNENTQAITDIIKLVNETQDVGN